MNKINISFVIYIFLLLRVSCFPSKNDTHIIYDQRQTGKFNIHFNIKDVAIIDVNSNEFVDDAVNDPDEYYYDEDDLTVNPLLTWTPSPSEAEVNYSENGTLREKYQFHQLDNIRNESNTFNFTTKIENNTGPRKDFPKQLFKKPVLIQHDESKDNIPLSSLKGAQQNAELNEKIVIPSVVRRKRNPNSKMLNVLSALFNRSVRCNNRYRTIKIDRENKNNRNCNKIKQASLINSFLGLMQLIRTKDN